MSGNKFDADKPRMDLLPPHALREVARVLVCGAAKYGDHNWREGIAFSRVYAAAQRHLNAYWDGEDLDSESGLPHLAHATCCLLFLLTYTKEHPELDDRYKKGTP